jgi:hypothetical protein
MKKIFFMMVVVACASFAQGSEFADRQYFNQQFNFLQQSVAEVKGDTTQIVEILGNVFEGTVPSGGTLTGLCNQNGWNLIVLMGHNGISNPNRVAAGASFTYPKTTAEFQEALRKGKPLYREWLKHQKTTFRVNRIQADSVDLNRLNVKVMNVTEQLKIKNMEIDQLKVRLAEVTEQLRIKQLDIQQLNVDQANFRQVNIDQLRIKQLEIDNLKALCEQMRRRCAELESRPVKVVTKTVYSEVGYNAPASMRLMKEGDVCDERIVHGGVPSAVWKATGGKSVAIFELHQRDDAEKIAEGTQFKAKSLVVINASTAIPMVWEDGTCIRMYKSEPLDEVDFRSMMSSDENLDMIEFSDANKKFKGRHNTIGVVLRYAK